MPKSPESSFWCDFEHFFRRKKFISVSRCFKSVCSNWVIYDSNIDYCAETGLEIPWLSLWFFELICYTITSHSVINISEVTDRLSVIVPDSRLGLVSGQNSANSNKSNNAFSVLITQKSVNNDEPPPSPNIKSNGLPKESSITSSEVSYGMDQNLFPEGYNYECDRPHGLRRPRRSALPKVALAY